MLTDRQAPHQVHAIADIARTGLVGLKAALRRLAGGHAIPGLQVFTVTKVAAEAGIDGAEAALIKRGAQVQFQVGVSLAGVLVGIFLECVFQGRADYHAAQVVGRTDAQLRARLDLAHAYEAVGAGLQTLVFILARGTGADIGAETQGIAFVTPAQALAGIEEDSPGADDFAAQHWRGHAFVAAAVAWRVGHAGLEAVLPVFGNRGVGGGEQAQ